MSWSKRIRIVFDGRLYKIPSDLKNYFRLVEAYDTFIYPYSVTLGQNENELYLNFNDIYRAVQPLTLEYLGGSDLAGKDFDVEAFTLIPSIVNINPSDVDEYLCLSGVDVAGSIVVTFDGKAYDNEYLRLGEVTVAGTVLQLTFYDRYTYEYLQLASITVSGQYCDINGVPL